MSATRTLNPLHFGDLEPHRFEDLIRQLAYGFRPWRTLEATGRKGNDEGVDIRGYEIVQTASRSSDEDDDDISAEPDREWRFQVKRYKELGPTELRKVVAEGLASGPSPYGFVVAVGCDVSADALAAFREETLAKGVIEAHVWMRSHIEDLLFRPENDHLLFAYFDISLQTKQRSRLAGIRAAISVRRKLRQGLGVDEDGDLKDEGVLVCDVDRDDFLDPECLADPVPPAQPVEIQALGPRGLVVRRFRYYGIVKPDGTWDFDPNTRWSPGNKGAAFWEARAGDANPLRMPRERIPDIDRRSGLRQIIELGLVPYGQILEVDPHGSDYMPLPHVYCQFVGEHGPFAEGRSAFSSEGEELKPALRRDYCQSQPWNIDPPESQAPEPIAEKPQISGES